MTAIVVKQKTREARESGNGRLYAWQAGSPPHRNPLRLRQLARNTKIPFIIDDEISTCIEKLKIISSLFCFMSYFCLHEYQHYYFLIENGLAAGQILFSLRFLFAT